MTDTYNEYKFKNNRLERALSFLVHVIDSKLLRCEINLILLLSEIVLDNFFDFKDFHLKFSLMTDIFLINNIICDGKKL